LSVVFQKTRATMKPTPRSGKPGFTLVELMAVVTIIVILAGLVVGGMGFANESQAKKKAVVQMALISKSLEEYKIDNGQYPLTTNSPSGSGNSDILFNALYFDSDGDKVGPVVGSGSGDTDQKMYLIELDPNTSKQGWTSGVASAKTKIKDPWGNEYRYRTAVDLTGQKNDDTQNPDFDLWSTGKDGKTEPGTPKDPKNNDDIKSP
jgi:general secretion pathway protein G